MDVDDTLSGMPHTKRAAGGRRLLACLGLLPLAELTQAETDFVMRQMIDTAGQCVTSASEIVGDPDDGRWMFSPRAFTIDRSE